MAEEETIPSKEIVEEPLTKVAVVAPQWLFEALVILLQSEDSLLLVTNALTVAELLSQPLRYDPDVVLIDGKREVVESYEQVSQIKARWSKAKCIILVEHIRQREVLKAAGADQVLVKGISPQRLLSAIQNVEARRASKKETKNRL